MQGAVIVLACSLLPYDKGLHIHFEVNFIYREGTSSVERGEGDWEMERTTKSAAAKSAFISTPPEAHSLVAANSYLCSRLGANSYLCSQLVD